VFVIDVFGKAVFAMARIVSRAARPNNQTRPFFDFAGTPDRILTDRP
jgi:hypothetical protein